MLDRQASYWISVLVIGPVAGLVSGCVWGLLMALILGPTLTKWIIPGILFGIIMAFSYTAMFAIGVRTVRKEWLVKGDIATRNALLNEAKRLRYRLSHEDGNYLQLTPRTLLKPQCGTIEVWLAEHSVVFIGPTGALKKLFKRLSKAESGN